MAHEAAKKHIERGRRWAAIKQKKEYCDNIKWLANKHKKDIKAGNCGINCQDEIKELLKDTKKNCRRNVRKVEALLPKEVKLKL